MGFQLMVFDIYHDECKEDGYWHGFLFVPRSTRRILLMLLETARQVCKHPHPLHYVRIGRSADPNNKAVILTHAWTTIGCAALQQHKLNKYPPKIFLGRAPGRNSPAHYRILDALIKCRFVLFRECDKHELMYAGMNGLQCIETTFRMGLKGGVHLLFDNDDPVSIGDVFIDGDEHYKGEYGRTFDVSRTLRRLAQEKRPFVSFEGTPRIIPQRSDHSKIESSQNPEDSQLLQLCDALIGGFRFHACFADVNHPRYLMSKPCREILEHEQGNLARMANSRYLNGFSLQQARLVDDEWEFSAIIPDETSSSLRAQYGLRLN
jgi:hypothetical protein